VTVLGELSPQRLHLRQQCLHLLAQGNILRSQDGVLFVWRHAASLPEKATRVEQLLSSVCVARNRLEVSKSVSSPPGPDLDIRRLPFRRTKTPGLEEYSEDV
jgi:hypothetical protein